MDPIVDMLNKIRNAQAVLHETVDIPFSNLKYAIVKIFEKEKFVEKVEKKGRGVKKIIKITLKYDDKTPAISRLKRVSKQGQRIYFSVKKIKPVHGGYGISIFSTPKGLMTNKEARRHKLGGELICEIW
ncbi:30S ribosomal protein S8 [Patescibacteria group bacterium]